MGNVILYALAAVGAVALAFVAWVFAEPLVRVDCNVWMPNGSGRNTAIRVQVPRYVWRVELRVGWGWSREVPLSLRPRLFDSADASPGVSAVGVAWLGLYALARWRGVPRG